MSNSITQPRGGKRASEISLAVTLGKGANRPKGQRTPLDTWTPTALADLLNEHIGVEAWFSLHLWRNDTRDADNWVGATGVVLDVDRDDHADLPEATADRLTEAAHAGRLPCNLFYLTPAGARFLWLFDEVVTDAQVYSDLLQACRRDAEEVLHIAGLPDLSVDERAMDYARMFYAPRAIAKGKRRNSKAVVVHQDPLTAEWTHETLKPTKLGCPEAQEAHANVCGAGAKNPTGFGPEQLRSIEDAIAATVPERSGKRNRQVFPFARRLKAIAGDVPVTALRPFVEQWHAAGVTGGVFETQADSQGSGDTWAEFLYAWPRVRTPFGEPGEAFAAAVERAQAGPSDEVRRACGLVGLDARDQLTIASLCSELHELHDGQPFRLPSRLAAKAAGCSHQKAWRILQAFAAVGVLDQLERGESKSDVVRAGRRRDDAHAAVYRWKGGDLL